MAYTLPQCITEVRRGVNEAVASFYDDAELTQWLAQGALDVSAKARCVETIVNLSLTAGTANYVMTTGVIGVDTVIIGASSLAKIRGRQLGHIHGGQEQTPSHFSYFGGQIRFFGTPQISATAVLYQWSRTTDVTLLPDHYQILAIDYAIIRAKVKDRKMAEAAQMYAIYARSLQFMRNDLQDYVPDSRESMGFPDRIQVQQNG